MDLVFRDAQVGSLPHEACFVVNASMALTSEDLVLRLADTVRRMPNLRTDPITPELNQWLAQATALVEMAGGLIDGSMIDGAVIKTSAQFLGGSNRLNNAQQIEIILRHTLARLELSSMRGDNQGETQRQSG